MDYRYVLLTVAIIIIIGLLIPQPEPEYYFYQDQNVFDGDHRIIVNRKLFDKFVDILLDYVYKAENKEQRTLYVYMATFHIMVKNFHPKRLEHLEKKLDGAILVKTDIYYPAFDKYPNLQAVIGNMVGRELTNTERNFTGDAKRDRKMVESYLTILFDAMGVVRVA